MDWSTIGLLLSLGTVVFFYLKLKKKEQIKKGTVETVQDLLRHKNLKENGLMELEGGTFATVLEVHPINIKMKSQSERDGVWVNFRVFLNSLPIPATLLVSSQYLDMTEYIEEYQATSADVNLTPELRESVEDVSEHLKGFSDRKTRDYRSYVILRFNPWLNSAESGIGTGNMMIDDIIGKIRGEVDKMTEEEAIELAENMMDEACDLVYQSFDSFGCKVARLNKLGTLHMLHQILNRNLAPYERVHSVYETGGFTDSKQSLTPHLSLAREKEVETA